MSENYAESNSESSRELFEKRNLFRALQGSAGSPIIDFNFGEKFFYGRVDRNFIPIVAKLDLLRDFNNSLVEAGTTSDLNFVVWAFTKLNDQFKKCFLQQKIAPADPYLTNLRIYRGNESHESLYVSHLNEVTNAIQRHFIAEDIQVRDFQDFVNHFFRIMETHLGGTAFTKTAFIKSAKCSIAVSGLTVEIADIDPTDDQKKIDFMSSPNWGFFKNACRSYGFMIDANVPYRMVADLGSSAMMEYAREYGFGSTDDILKNAYMYVHDEYFPKFRYFMLKLYQKLRAESFLEIGYCADTQTTTTVTVRPTKYSINDFDAEFDEMYFLNIYARLRLLETSNSGLTESQISILVDDCGEMYGSLGLSRTLEIFEFIINKPFDYSGSLSYIYDKLEAMKRAEEEKLGKSNPRSADFGESMDGGY